MSGTDTADELIIDLSPPKKRRKKNHLSVELKAEILNLYKSEVQENPGLPIEDIAIKTAEKVGVSRSSVFNVVKEYKRSHTFSKPATNQNRKNSIQLLGEMEKHAIRRKVHEFLFRNEMPTVDKVLRVVNDDPALPNFKRTTFFKLLKDLQFKHKKCGRNSMVIDSNEVVLWRREYLVKIKSFRNENRKIYYLDETWVNVGYTKAKVSVDESVASSRQAFLDGLSTCLKNPTGKGNRLIICHIGSEDGFVEGGLWCCKSKKTGDYYEEMNGGLFEKWFADILPRLEENCVIVLDNASYHSRKAEKIPTAASKKLDVQNWLRSKNIEFDESVLKLQLLALVKEHKKNYDKFIIDEMAKAQNKTVLRLPPYHCQLNPMELIWANAKKIMADNNKTFRLAEVKELFNSALQKITKNEWQKCVEHVILKVEGEMWELDNITERQIERLIVNGGDDESSSSSSE